MAVVFAPLLFAGDPENSPDPMLVSLRSNLERAILHLDPRPTFEIPDSSAGRTLAVRFKTREYDLRMRIKSGAISERSMKREGPSAEGFLLRAHIQPLGEVNQAVVPQTLREQYWSTFVDVYPAKTEGKQIYLALSYGKGTDEKIINTMKMTAEQTARGDSTNRADAVRGSPQQ